MATPTPEPDVAVLGKRMRADRLDRANLIRYAELLAERAEGDAAAWSELLLLASCYLRDPELALDYARKACEELPENSGLAEWKKRLEVWTLGNTT